jgi:uncharacterized alkaline shock family protein YloU
MTDMNTENEIGTTTVSTEVLHKIARLTTLSVQGVSRMASCKGNLEHFRNPEECKGVKVQIKDGFVYVDIFVVLISNMNVRDISREIQSRVSRAILEMIGMDVGGINIHISDIDFNS